jgi:hypothetical protein
MIDTLYKVVRKVIVPQYPWIKDFVWTSNYYGGTRYYALELIVDKDFYLNHPDASHIYHKLFNDTRMLFRMVGAEENEFFDDVTISPEDDD